MPTELNYDIPNDITHIFGIDVYDAKYDSFMGTITNDLIAILNLLDIKISSRDERFWHIFNNLMTHEKNNHFQWIPIKNAGVSMWLGTKFMISLPLKLYVFIQNDHWLVTDDLVLATYYYYGIGVDEFVAWINNEFDV